MENNNGVKEAKEKLEDMSNDEIMRRLAEWEESAKHEEASMKASAMRRGLKEGLEKGMEQGMEQGRKAEKLEIAKKMKQKGSDLVTIAELTGLSKSEIEKL